MNKTNALTATGSHLILMLESKLAENQLSPNHRMLLCAPDIDQAEWIMLNLWWCCRIRNTMNYENLHSDKRNLEKRASDPMEGNQDKNLGSQDEPTNKRVQAYLLSNCSRFRVINWKTMSSRRWQTDSLAWIMKVQGTKRACKIKHPANAKTTNQIWIWLKHSTLGTTLDHSTISCRVSTTILQVQAQEVESQHVRPKELIYLLHTRSLCIISQEVSGWTREGSWLTTAIWAKVK